MLKTLLVMDGAGRLRRLLSYVVATCYPKLCRRLQHKHWSKPYLECLRNVAANGHNNFTPSNMSPSSAQRQNDKNFLETYVLVHVKPRDLGNDIKIPRITEKAKSSCTHKDSYIDIYDAETCDEFSKLVSHLLRTYECALGVMEAYRTPPVTVTESGGKRRRRRQRKATSDKPKPSAAAFDKALVDAVTAGIALLQLSKGAALPAYLKNIDSLLLEHHRTIAQMREYWESEEQERDHDLEGAQPEMEPDPDSDDESESNAASGGQGRSHSKPRKQPWECCLNWVKVVLSHFEGVYTLHGFIDKEPIKPTISIRILVSPPVDYQLLSWKVLLADNLLFPPSSPNFVTKAGIPVQDIHNFQIVENLNKARGPGLFSKEFSRKLRCLTFNQHEVEELWNTLNSLSNCEISTLSRLATKIIKKSFYVDAVKYQTHDPDNPTKTVETIKLRKPDEFPKDLKTLLPWSQFFDWLNDYDGDNRVQMGFTGTLHCEVGLASLLHQGVLDGDRFKDIAGLEDLKVCYIALLPLPSVSHFITDFRARYRSIKTLLPCM